MINIHLSRLLGERKLKQSDLIRATGICANTISYLYHDIAGRISLDHLDKICEALDCPLEELISRIPNKVVESEEFTEDI